MRPFSCPMRPVSGLRRLKQPYEDCSSPDVCFKRGCLLARAPISDGCGPCDFTAGHVRRARAALSRDPDSEGGNG